jgi:hypothetical protein
MVKQFMLIAAAAAAIASLTGCAGRDSRPIQISQMQDSSMSCEQLRAEIAGNNRTISDLGSEKGGKIAQNIAAGVGGVLFPPLLFAMDFKGAAGTEQRALEQRNAYLATTAQRCNVTATGEPS